MKIECFLCSKVIPVQASKKGLPWFYCDDCQFRGFVNSEQGVAGLEAHAIDNEPFEGKPKAEPVKPTRSSPSPDSSHVDDKLKTIIDELKAQGREIAKLKETGAPTPRPSTRKKPKTAPKKSMTFGEHFEANA